MLEFRLDTTLVQILSDAIMDDKDQQFNYFETGMKMSVKCVNLIGKAYDGRNQDENAGAEENGRYM